MLENRLAKTGRGLAVLGLSLGLLGPLVSPEHVLAAKKIPMTGKVSCEPSLAGGAEEDRGLVNVVTLQIERPAGAQVSKVEVKRGKERLSGFFVRVNENEVIIRHYTDEESHNDKYSAKLRFNGRKFKTVEVPVRTRDCNYDRIPR